MLDVLAQELAKLYTDIESAKRVAQEAGIPTSYLVWDGTAADVWSRIVRQADLRHLVPNLLSVTTREWKTNSTLQQIYGTYLYAKTSSIVVSGNDGDLRPDMETLARIEKAVIRLDAIVRGNPELGIDEGLMQVRRTTDAKIDMLIRDVARLTVDVLELKENQRMGRRLSYTHIAITLVLALSVALTLWVSWGAA